MKQSHNIEGAVFQCVNNHYAKFEYNGWILLKLQITQTRHPLSISDGEKCLCSTPVKNEKKIMKCAQYRRCTSSMCEQSLCEV